MVVSVPSVPTPPAASNHVNESEKTSEEKAAEEKVPDTPATDVNQEAPEEEEEKPTGAAVVEKQASEGISALWIGFLLSILHDVWLKNLKEPQPEQKQQTKGRPMKTWKNLKKKIITTMTVWRIDINSAYQWNLGKV